MSPLLLAMVASGAIDRQTADRIDRSMDPEAMRVWAEAELQRAFGGGLNAQQGRLIDLIRGNPNPTAAQWDRFWASESDALWAATGETLTQVAGEVAVLQASTADLEGVFSFINQQTTDWVHDYYINADALNPGAMGQLNLTSRTQFAQVFEDWRLGRLGVTGGRADGLPQLIRAAADVFGPKRAAAIAITETTRVRAESQRQIEAGEESTVGFRVQTAADERVCFPAGTMVTTSEGDRPIEKIEPGDWVQTRVGLRRVLAASKRGYSGPMTTVSWGNGSVTATSNHPFWTLEKGWLNCGQLNIGHTLQSVPNQPVRITGVVNFNVGDTANLPTKRFQVLRFPNVFFGVRMPVHAVNFNRNPEFRKQEVNAISAHLSFLDVFNSVCFQKVSDKRLVAGFALKIPVARKTAKLSVRIAGNLTKLFSAITARNENGRAATFFRTIMPVQSLFGGEHLSASFAGDILGGSSSAFVGTDSVSVRNHCGDFKLFPANRASFGNHNRSTGGLVTGPVTIVPLLGELRTRQWFSALSAHTRLRGTGNVVAQLSAVLLMGLRRKHAERFPAILAQFFNHFSPFYVRQQTTKLYHRQSFVAIDVYNIQVEERPEFYANGVLVHNCPICGPLHGQMSEKGSRTFNHPTLGPIEGPPFHVRCRCGIVGFTKLTEGIRPLGDTYEYDGPLPEAK